jgi:nicotinate-nucleotide--dimethylbenzimidazole phosphoribosyltransferase
VSHKVAVITAALALHGSHIECPLDALRYFGGFEIAALSGAFIACAQMGLPVLVDGFIASAAALVVTRQCPGTTDWLLYSHASAEPGHRLILQALSAEPLLDLNMRLGEGSGAAVAVPLLRMACALHSDMATFAEAEVSGSL